MRALAMTGLLVLAGCSSAGDENANAANAATELPRGPMLGSVDLSLPVEIQGTSASWRMAIAPGEITFAEAPGRAPVDFYPVSPKADRAQASYSTRTPDGEPVTIMLADTPCGEARLPLTADVRIGARSFAGCAQQRGAGAPASEATNTAG